MYKALEGVFYDIIMTLKDQHFPIFAMVLSHFKVISFNHKNASASSREMYDPRHDTDNSSYTRASEAPRWRNTRWIFSTISLLRRGVKLLVRTTS